MKLTVITFIILWVAPALPHKGYPYFQQPQGTLTVKIKGVKSQEGLVRVNLYNSSTTNLKKPLKQLTVEPQNENSIDYAELPYGEYSLLAFHDENENGKLDHSFGFPAEPLGWGNGWEFGLFSGTPSFEKTKILLNKKNKVITITLK